MAEDKKKCPYAGDKEKCPAASGGYPKPGKVDKSAVEAAKKCENSKKYECPYLSLYYYYSDKKPKESMTLTAEEISEAVAEAASKEDLKSWMELAEGLFSGEELEKIQEVASLREKALSGEPVEATLNETYVVKTDNVKDAQKLTVILGPLNEVNRNGRRYRKDVIEESSKEINQLIKQGKAVSCIVHDTMRPVSDPHPDDIVGKVVNFDIVEHEGKPHMAFTIQFLETEAASKIRNLLAQGVNFDLSTRASGRVQRVQEGKQEFDDVIEYHWYGIDFTLVSGFPSQNIILEHAGGAVIVPEPRENLTENGNASEPEQAKVQEPQGAPVEQVNEGADKDEESKPTPSEPDIEEKIRLQARREAFALAADALTERAVEAAVSELGLTGKWAEAFKRSVGSPKTEEELHEKLEGAKSLYRDMIESMPEEFKQEPAEEKSAKDSDLPETREEVIEHFAEGVRNPEEFKAALQNLASLRDTKWYIDVYTREGRAKYERMLNEATTTSDLVYYPLMLPVIQLVWRDLNILDLVYTLPVRRSRGTIPSVTFKTEGGTDLTDYAYEALDASEASAKPLVKISMGEQTFTCVKKAAAFQWSDEADEEMQDNWGINIEDFLRKASMHRLSIDINIDVLGDLLTAAAAGTTDTFKQTAPSGTDQDVWITTGFAVTLGKLLANVQKSSGVRPNFILCGATAGVYFSALNGFAAEAPDENGKASFGFARLGTYQSRYSVYQVDNYLDDNTLVVGYAPKGRPEDVLPYAGVVFLPYILGRLTDVQVDALNDQKARGVYSRYAKVTLRNDIYGKLTIESGTATGWPI